MSDIQQASEEIKISKIRPLHFVSSVVFRFVAFARAFLISESKSAPGWFVLVWAGGVSNKLADTEIESVLLGETAMPKWAVFWVVVLMVGLVRGYIGFYIQGAFFYGFIRLCGGRTHFGAAANVALYAGLPAIIATFLATLVEVIVVRSQATVESPEVTVYLVVVAILVIGFGWSVRLAYLAVRQLFGGGKWRARFIVVGVPTVAFVGLLAAGAMQGWTESDEAITLNDEGLEAYMAGRDEAAIDLYQEALSQLSADNLSDRVTILQNLASAYESFGDLEASSKAYEDALELLPPNSPEAYWAQSKVALAHNDVREGIIALQKSLELDASDPWVHNALVEIYLGDHDEGFANYERALEAARSASQLDEDGTIIFNLGRALYFLDRESEAIPLFQRVIEDSNDVVAHVYLGLSHYELGAEEEAIKVLSGAIERDPSLEDSYAAEVLAELKK